MAATIATGPEVHARQAARAITAERDGRADGQTRCGRRREHATRRSGFYANLRPQLYRLIESESVDPVRNPYAPGAGQRPRSWPAATVSSSSSRWCSNGWPAAGPNAA